MGAGIKQKGTFLLTLYMVYPDVQFKIDVDGFPCRANVRQQKLNYGPSEATLHLTSRL